MDDSKRKKVSKIKNDFLKYIRESMEDLHQKGGVSSCLVLATEVGSNIIVVAPDELHNNNNDFHIMAESIFKSCHELMRQNILNDRSEITYFGRVKEITAYETVASILKLTVGDDVPNNRLEMVFKNQANFIASTHTPEEIKSLAICISERNGKIIWNYFYY